MQATWSLIFNVLLLIGVIIAIGRMMKTKRQNAIAMNFQPTIGDLDTPSHDDIIAVRKINREPYVEPPVMEPISAVQEESTSVDDQAPVSSLMMFLLAKDNRQLAGYELLQTVLAAGLRFGEGHLFHRHQHPNGQGPILCSLAAATASGVFDLQNIGAFSVHGLCLFMQASGNPTIDAERFTIMLDTAKQLSEGLDTHLLDDQRKPLTDASLQRYHRMLNLGE